jgi:hypothetical protein
MTHFYNDSENQHNSTLVLCVEEYEYNELGRDPENIDARIFIQYSHEHKEFYIYGRRQDTDYSNKEYVPFMYNTTNKSSLFEFVDLVSNGNDSLKSITLYNFNNMHESEDDIKTYEFFEEHMDAEYEVVAYDNISLDRKHFMKYVNVMRNIV